jgi:hypothetical protein
MEYDANKTNTNTDLEAPSLWKDINYEINNRVLHQLDKDSLYNIITTMYRNDYGLTIANRIVNGHIEHKQDYLPWSLTHVNKQIKVYKNNDTPFNTEYTLIKERQYLTIKDIDFHMMSKTNFMELV